MAAGEDETELEKQGADDSATVQVFLTPQPVHLEVVASMLGVSSLLPPHPPKKYSENCRHAGFGGKIEFWYWTQNYSFSQEPSLSAAHKGVQNLRVLKSRA